MLVVTRKPGERIAVGEEIEITIVSVDGEAVRIGIKAPRSVPVYRAEVLEAIGKENLRAAQSAAGLKDLSDLLKEQKKE